MGDSVTLEDVNTILGSRVLFNEEGAIFVPKIYNYVKVEASKVRNEICRCSISLAQQLLCLLPQFLSVSMFEDIQTAASDEYLMSIK